MPDPAMCDPAMCDPAMCARHTIHLEIGICPRLAMNRYAPLVIDITVTAHTFFGAQCGENTRRIACVHGALKGWRYHKYLHRADESPSYKGNHQNHYDYGKLPFHERFL